MGVLQKALLQKHAFIKVKANEQAFKALFYKSFKRALKLNFDEQTLNLLYLQTLFFRHKINFYLV